MGFVCVSQGHTLVNSKAQMDVNSISLAWSSSCRDLEPGAKPTVLAHQCTGDKLHLHLAVRP